MGIPNTKNMTLGNQEASKRDVQSTLDGIFGTIKKFNDDMEKRLEKADKKFGFIEESHNQVE